MVFFVEAQLFKVHTRLIAIPECLGINNFFIIIWIYLEMTDFCYINGDYYACAGYFCISMWEVQSDKISFHQNLTLFCTACSNISCNLICRFVVWNWKLMICHAFCQWGLFCLSINNINLKRNKKGRIFVMVPNSKISKI